MRIVQALITAAISTVVLAAAEKPNFSGTWRMEPGNSESAPLLKIEQNDSELKISSAAEKEKTELTCNTVGKECEGTMHGEHVRVSYWYNGPMLVQMVFEGKDNDRVTETRRRLSEDGQKMTVEVIPIVPAGKSADKLVFVKDQQVMATASPDR
jgi:hypothetical protein